MGNQQNSCSKLIALCLVLMLCATRMIECRPTLKKLGSIHTVSTIGKKFQQAKLPNGVESSATWCFTKIKYETRNVCLGNICRDVTVSKTVYECIGV